MKRLNLASPLLFLFFLAGPLIHASDLKEIASITDRILALHFEDGQVQYHGYHQTDAQDKVTQIKLNLEKASQVNSYLITSSDDGAYAAGLRPARVGRKSKGNGFSRNCRWDGQRCNNDYTLEHWIYLQLPQPLTSGRTYNFNTGDLAANGQDWVVKFDELHLRSFAIHVNQVGYRPQASRKFAYISQWMGDLGPLSLEGYAGNTFHLVRVDNGKTSFSGAIGKQKDFATGGPDTGQPGDTPGGNFVGADVWQCDFSSFQDPGEYVLVIEGLGCSYPFSIGSDVYRQAFYTATRGLYHQRSGIDLVEPYTHWSRKADHRVGVAPGFSLKYTSYRFMDSVSESGPEAEVRARIMDSVDTTNMWGWYHDAGDWDAYPSHAEVPAYLLTAFELAPLNFKDGELNIPESGNGIPDILDEASWLLDFYRRAKGPTGGVAGSRVHGDFSPEPQGIPSYEDTRQWIVFGEEPLMTFNYAALAAQLSYGYQIASKNGRLGPGIKAQERIDLWISEARKAYQWASDNTLSGDSIREARAYAAAWLYKTTGEAAYQARFIGDLAVTSGDIHRFADFRWAIWAYITIPTATPGLDRVLVADLVAAAKNYAQQEVTDAIGRNRSFRMGGNWNMPVIVGQPTTPLVLPAMMAYQVSGEQKFLDAISTTCDYMPGGNPLDMVWVSGLGRHSPTQLLHLDSWYGSTPGVIPGIVPYGPNHKCDWMAGPGGNCDYNGPWDADYSRTTAYPNADLWPVHELFFENRYAPATNEFTIHQNIAAAAAAFGYLSGPIAAGDASIALSIGQARFSYVIGGISPASARISISNGGSGILEWSAICSAPWLNVSPTAGTAPSTLTVSVDAGTLQPGIYSGTVTITASGATNSPQIVAVTFIVTAASSGIFPQVAIGGDTSGGGVYSTTFTLLNTGVEPVTGNLVLTGQEGMPWIASLNSAGTITVGSSIPISIGPGGTAIVVAAADSGDATLHTGWGRVDSSGGTLSGVATFQQSAGGMLRGIAGVLSSSLVAGATIPVDDDVSSGRYTGYAIANTSSGNITVKVREVAGESGTAVALTDIALAPAEQKAAFFFQDAKASREFRGSAVLIGQNDAKFAVIAFDVRQNLLTAIPVIPRYSPNIQ